MSAGAPPPAAAPPPRRSPWRRRLAWARRGAREFLSRDWQGAVSFLVVAMFATVAISAALTSAPKGQLSAYDDDWNDISAFRRDMESLGFLNLTVRTVSSSAATLESIEDPRGMVYMAIGVERPYTFAEWRAIRYFLERGGQVVVADDYGHGNTLLRFHGFVDNPAVTHIGDDPLTYYIWSGERLADVRTDRNPQLVWVSVPVWEGLTLDLLLNDPSCFVANDDWSNYEPWRPQWERSSPGEVIANSTGRSWLDTDRDGVRDPGEKVGEYPVIIYQDGMILISDPSMFTNDMYQRGDNRLFAHVLLAHMLPQGGTIIVDEGVHLEPGLLSELDDVFVRPMMVLLGEDWPIYSGLVALVVGLFGMGLASKRGRRRYQPHVDRLGETTSLPFGHPYNWLMDYYEVRGVLLQRMRYAYGLDPDDLQRLPPEIVAQLLGDPYLVQFVLQPIRVDPAALEAALADIANWEPPPNAEALVERAERYLAAIPEGAAPAWGQGPTVAAQAVPRPYQGPGSPPGQGPFPARPGGGGHL